MLAKIEKNKQMTVDAAKDVGKGNNCLLLVCVQTGTTTIETSMALPQKTGNRCATFSGIALLGMRPKDYTS